MLLGDSLVKGNIEELKAQFYRHWSLKYPPRCATAATAVAHFSGYFSMHQACIPNVKCLT